MADEQRTEELLIKVTTVKQSFAQARSDLAVVRGDMSKFSEQVNASRKASATLNDELLKIGRQRYFTTLAREVGTAKKGTDEWVAATAKLNSELGRLKASQSDIANVARTIAEARAETDAAAAVAGTRGGRGSSLRAIGTQIRNLPSQQIPGLGIGTDAIGNFARLGGALGVTTTQAVALGGAAAGLVVALKLAQDQFNRTKEAAEAELNARKTVLELIRTSTTEELQAKAEELRRDRDINQAKLDDAKNTVDSLKRGIFDAFGGQGGLGLQALGLAQVGAMLGIGAGDLAAAEQSLAEANKELNAGATELRYIDQVLAEGKPTREDILRAEQELTKAREAAIPRLEALAEQANNAILNFQEQNSTIFEDRRIRDARAEEDWQLQQSERLEAHLDRLAAIDQQGTERLVAIRNQGNEKIAQADGQLAKLNASIADVATKLRDDLAKIDRDFMRDEREDYAKFRADLEKADKEYNKKRIRLLEDLNDDLLDAEQANDVAQFVKLQRDGEKELRRLAEDQDEKSKQEQAAFEEERRIAADRRAERIADLQAAAEERRADLQEQLAEREAAKRHLLLDIEEQLKAERERINATMEAQREAYKEDQERLQAARDLRLKRQLEDDKLADDRRLAQLNKQLADIALKAQKEAEAIGIVGSSLQNLIAAVQSGTTSAISAIINQANAARVSSSGSFGSGTSSSSYLNPNSLLGRVTNGLFSGLRPFGFAEGSHGRGIENPTFRLLGEKPGWGDLVIPYPKGRGAQIPGIGGKQVIVNLNAPITGVTEEFVSRELHKMGQTLIEFEAEARAG